MENRCENCIIRQLNALKALDKNALKIISDSKQTRSVKKGETIFKEGEKLNGVFCVRNGASKLSKISENGKTQIVKIAAKGEVLGQRSVITKESTNLSAVALNNMEVCFIPKKHLEENLDTNVRFTKEILLQMAKDLKEADDVIVNVSQKTVKQRIVEVILYLKEKFGEDDEGNLALTISRTDIADIAGSATEACIRTLSNLKKENLIAIKGKKIKILELKRLLSIAKGY